MKEVSVPDLGGNEGEVIEIHVAKGDVVETDQDILTLESEKASLDIPMPFGGKVEEVCVSLGDKLSEGDCILKVSAANDDSAVEQDPLAEKAETEQPGASQQTETQVHLPDIGGGEGKVIEVHIQPGDIIELDQDVVTLESEKATLDVPAPLAGEVIAVHVKLDDTLQEGALLMTVRTKEATEKTQPEAPKAPQQSTSSTPQQNQTPMAASRSSQDIEGVHAGPSVRRLARELDIDLSKIKGTGPRSRITKEDLLKTLGASNSSGGAGSALPAMPEVDFSQYGPVEVQECSRIRQLTAQAMFRNWVNIPHVTHFDEIDITELEAYRKATKESMSKDNVKLTLLPFLIKGIVKALQEFPDFNASLSPDAKQVTLKKYWHIGVAMDTEHGLVVPVIRDANHKGAVELAKELTVLAEKARENALKPQEMQGGTFTISSLGALGGQGFTPIINAPEVAILGVAKAEKKPVYINDKLEPRLMLPVCLSYDHRAIDGASAARFVSYFKWVLQDIRLLLF